MGDLESYHNVTDLFDQLGLPSDHDSIESFVQSHKPLADHINLWEASFWSVSQADFLKSSFEEDAGWAVAMDELNRRLRG